MTLEPVYNRTHMPISQPRGANKCHKDVLRVCCDGALLSDLSVYAWCDHEVWSSRMAVRGVASLVMLCDRQIDLVEQ